MHVRAQYLCTHGNQTSLFLDKQCRAHIPICTTSGHKTRHMSDTSAPALSTAPTDSSAPKLTDLLSSVSGSHTLSSTTIVIGIVGAVTALVVLVFAGVWINRLHKFNAQDCPVLLASPIRGSDFTTMPSAIGSPMFPVIDRVVLNNKGISLPFQGNELALAPTEPRLPLLNNQVQFTLNFWMRVENMDVQSDSGVSRGRVTNDTSSYATLFAMNTGNVSRGGQFAVQYNSAHNELVVSVAVIPPAASGASLSTEIMQVFRIPNMLKLQKWQMVTVVLDNRNVDIYHNSKLHRSYMLPNVPYFNNSGGSLWKRPSWTLFPGSVPFGGTVSCARYFNYAFNVHEAYRLYQCSVPSRPSQAPEVSYLLWWTWIRGGTITSMYRTLRNDVHSEKGSH